MMKEPDSFTALTRNLLAHRWATLKLHAFVVAIVSILFGLLENPSSTLIVGGMLCTLTYFVIGLMEGRKARLWFNPLSYYFFWYSVGLGLSAIYIGIATVSGDWMPFSTVMIPPENLAKAYVICLVGSVSFHAGLQVFRPAEPWEQPPDPHQAGKKNLWWLTAMWSVGLWSGWNPTLLAPLGAPGKILPWLSLAALCVFAITPRRQFGISKLTFITIFIIGTAGLFSANLMSFSKMYLMLSFFPLLWFFVIWKPVRRWLPVLGAALAVFYFTIVAPFVMIARHVHIQEGENQAARFTKMLRGEVPVYTAYLYEMSYAERIKMLLDRQFDPYPLGFLIEEVKLNGLQYGETMDYIAYSFVPRFFWPEKPNVVRGFWFAVYTGFALSEETSTVSLGITPTGELYWNFGIMGTLAGMFLIGGLLAGLWRMAGSTPAQPARMVLYVTVMLGLPYMAEAASLIVAIVVHFIVFRIVFDVLRLIRRAMAPIEIARIA